MATFKKSKVRKVLTKVVKRTPAGKAATIVKKIAQKKVVPKKKTVVKVAPKQMNIVAGKPKSAVVKQSEVKTAGNALLSPLIPLLPSMKEALKTKGINANTMDLATTTEKFYNEFVVKDKSLGNFDAIPDGEFSNSYLFRMPYKEFDPNDNVLGIDTTLAVGGKVVSFFKNRKAKKQAAKKAKQDPVKVLPKVDLILANAAEKVEKDLQTKAKAEQTAGKESVKTNVIAKYGLYIAITGLILFVGYLIIRKK